MTTTTGIQVFDNMITWQKSHEANIVETTQKLNEAQTGLDIFNAYKEYYDNIDKIGYEYNFMEGKDPNNEEDYSTQLQELGKAEILATDIDGDNQISFGEYVMAQTETLGENVDEETYAEVLTNCDLIFTIIDEDMENSDKNGYLSADEMASFYKKLDRYSLDENNEDYLKDLGDGKGYLEDQGDGKGYLEDQGDGKFNIDEASDFISYLINNKIEPEAYEELKGYYLDSLAQE